MRKPGFKSSLGGKLLLAIAVIAGFPATTGVLGWFELQDVARTQSRVVTEAIPAISEVRGVAEETSRVVAMAPELAAVTTELERVERSGYLLAQVDALRSRIARHADEAEGASRVALAAEQEVRASIRALERLVGQRIALVARRDAQLRQGLAAARELTEIADTLVANAEMGTAAVISNLYEIETGEAGDRQGRLDALDKLIEVDLFQLGLMFELRAHASEMGLLLNRVGAVALPGELALLRQELDERLKVVTRRILAVNDPRRAERALVLLRALGTEAVAPPESGGVFEAAGGVLDLTARIDGAQAELRVAAVALEEAAAGLADQIEARAVTAGAQAAQAIAATQRLYALSSVLALGLSLAVMWFYVRGNLIRRLERLTAGMFRLAEGGEIAPIAPRGSDEIARMEGAVEFFRRQSIANREFEEERGRHLIELRAHRNELQRLVDERTQQLRGEVAAHDVARARAEDADRAKSEFLAMMSHEVRTAMNGVLGMLRGLGRGGLRGAQRQQLDVALASGESLMGLLNSILDYSKLDGGMAVPEVVDFALPVALRDVALLMAPMAEEKGLTLELRLPQEGQPMLRGDMGKLRQVLFNLVSNAVKFTAAGKIVLSVDALGAGRYRFSVEDSGKGIAPEAMERIFAPFEQEDAQTARQFGGTGLGLAISRRLAELMGGTLCAQSRPGVGSTFVLEVGFEVLAEGPADVVPEAVPLAVLVVEDHPVNQAVMCACLEAMGHRLTVVATGEAAIAAAGRGGFDAILMDVNLPDLSGIEVTRRIRDRVAVPIIGVSAHVQPADVAACRVAGMDEVLAKPIVPERLAAVLAALCGAGAVGGAVAGTLADLGETQTAGLVSLMLERLRDEGAALADAMAEGKVPDRQRIAHQLKGAVGNFDLPEMVAMLDGLARDGEGAVTVDALRKALARTEAELRRSLAVLQRRGALMPAAQ